MTNEQSKVEQRAPVNILGIRAKFDGKTTVLPEHDGTILVKVANAGQVSFNPAKASLLNQKRAAFIGWKENLENTMAVELANVPAGSSAAEEKLRRVRARIEFLETGTDDWTAKVAVIRESPAERRQRELAERRGDVILALMHIRGISGVDEFEEWLKGRMSAAQKGRDETLDILGTADKVREEVLRIQAARAAQHANVELANGLLDEI